MTVARWEWRDFGERVQAAADRLSGLSPRGVEESDEVYLLSVEGEASVKVRDGLLDVKHLVRVSDEGLEQWMPVMKSAFPVAADVVGSALEALRAGVPPLARAAYTLDQLLGEIVRPSDDLLAVEVHKQRTRHTLGGCLAEMTEARVEGRVLRMVAVESEDPTRVLATLRALGLRPRPNVSVPRALGMLKGSGRRCYAVIDVGTNSVKLHVGERQSDDTWRTVVDRAEVTRLGDGLTESGRLDPVAMERTVAAIDGMVDEAWRNGADEIAAVGTAGLRTASTGAAFVEDLQLRCGIHVEIISGEEEARLSYVAATSGLTLREGSLVVFETGGGSSQFTFGHGAHVDGRFSIDVGAVNVTEAHRLAGCVSEDVLTAALDAIGADLACLDGRPTPGEIVGVGGTVTNLAAVKHGLGTYDPDLVHGTELDLAEIDRQIELYRNRTADERRVIVGLQPGRADIILAGACIVRTVLAKLGRDSLVASDRGLRHGLLTERFGL